MHCKNCGNEMTLTMVNDVNATRTSYRCDKCQWIAHHKRGCEVKWYPHVEIKNPNESWTP